MICLLVYRKNFPIGCVKKIAQSFKILQSQQQHMYIDEICISLSIVIVCLKGLSRHGMILDHKFFSLRCISPAVYSSTRQGDSCWIGLLLSTSGAFLGLTHNNFGVGIEPEKYTELCFFRGSKPERIYTIVGEIAILAKLPIKSKGTKGNNTSWS